jgi:hypothetical protein
MSCLPFSQLSARRTASCRRRRHLRSHHRFRLRPGRPEVDQLELAARARKDVPRRHRRLLLLRELHPAARGWHRLFPREQQPDQARCLASVGAAAASGVVLPFRLDYLVKIGTLRKLGGSASGSRRSRSRSSRSEWSTLSRCCPCRSRRPRRAPRASGRRF